MLEFEECGQRIRLAHMGLELVNPPEAEPARIFGVILWLEFWIVVYYCSVATKERGEVFSKIAL